MFRLSVLRAVTPVSMVTRAAAVTLPLACAMPLLIASPALAAGEPPAGGAATREVLIASAMAALAFSALVLIAMAHRAGRIPALERAGALAGRVGHLPPWVALPSAVLGVSLLLAVFGLYWDISLHISQGRDAGPLANPSHYFILVGLLGSFSAGVLACTMPKPGTRPSAIAVRLAKDWYAPLGGVLIALSAAFGLAGFPLDDLWHRMFGQDVTLWGPTHLLMLAGASLTLIGQAVLLVEGLRARGAEHETAGVKDQTVTAAARRDAVANKLRKSALAGGILAGLSIFQGEFDFGIPQFQLIFHPILLMISAGIALTFARSFAGRGGALMAAAFFIAVRGGLLLLVDGALDRPTPHFPLYLGSAIAVELAGIAMASSVRSAPMRFAAVAGIAIGTLGLAAEWAWSHVWMVFPWSSSLWPDGAIAGLAAAIAGAYIGAWIANSLAIRPRITGVSRFAPALGVVVIFALVGLGLNESPRRGLEATVTTQTVDTGRPGRWLNVTAKLNSLYFDDGTRWAQALSWQGPGFVNAPLKRVAPGTFQTTRPLPVSGKWKSVLRFHSGNSLMALPVYEPRDDAIPAAEVPAPASFARELAADRVVLQRESKVEGGVLAFTGYALMLLIALTLLTVLAWGIWRVGQPDEPGAGSAAGSGSDPGTGRDTRRASESRGAGGAPASHSAA